MVSAIKNQKVEERLNGMASSEKISSPAKFRSRFSPADHEEQGFSLDNYRRSLDRELHIHDRGLEDYSKALQLLVAKHAKPKKITLRERLASGFQKNKQTQSVDSLIREWGAQPEKSRIKRHAHFGHEAGHEQVRPEEPSFVSRFWRNPRQLPMALALVFLVATFLYNVLVPGTLGTGLLLNRSISLPDNQSATQVLLSFATPDDALLSADISDIDPRKFMALSVQDYVVQPGDTLSSISTRFNLNYDTIISFNNITNPKAIRIGQTYKIPNRNGLLYKVGKGDNLGSIAKKFEVNVTSMLDANNMADEAVAVGQNLFVPEARMNSTDLKLLLGELFLWPTVGRFTSSYGYRADPFTGKRALHNGIDLANAIGTPVRAALAGKVVAVAPLGGYGKMIMIQHERGFKTLYAHLNSFNVQLGQYVSQGQLIGRMGNTGRSTGPHLHFSVMLHGVFVNPMRYLK